ncbi:unnamed protein product [Orchesella dallaii]|uniref:C2H2-type domain-containing protein n=1 Tax=Orchesella dallaii TaxID=48710 RepID=A0ABP1QNF9_9HEXA
MEMESTLELEQDGKQTDDSVQRNSPASSHSEAVQALRKYLLRKMSSEEERSESSGDKESDSSREKIISVAESEGSKLYCSLVQRPAGSDQIQGNKKFLAKHKSLDLDDSTQAPSGLRYMRTDLCIPVLWSKCSFCENFFENDEQLRKHLRDSHFQYFLNYIQLRPLTTTKSLSDLPFSSSLQLSDKLLPSDGEISSRKPTSQTKKPVKCEVCGKCFTTKWNCKQHSKCHAKDGFTMMETDSSPGPSSSDNM